MKKLFSVFLSIAVVVLAACSKQPEDNKAAAPASALHKITLASSGSDTDIWRFIAKLPETKQAGIELDVKNFTDYVSMNTAVANKEIDVNAFQSYAYLVAFNAGNKSKIAPLATTYLEPMGIYSDKIKKLEDFTNGATIAVPNDPANEARALLLLQTAGLIKLKPDFDVAKGSPADIIENPKKLVIKEIPMATSVRVKSEVDAIVLGNVLAMEGGLNVLKDSIFHEPVDQSTKMNVNVLAVAEDRQNDPELLKLKDLYHSEPVKQFIQEKFQGTKVDVNEPISYLTGEKQ
ncbi:MULTISPECIES: MetQ/NlpA family ABC transporter substrate-binding protein [unclassified Acinetobacter]|uniref:MetQ/NlpA family ABC transporter substrate-binding protein n=1 Tax=unclassified Acinetobacter TaxID=196816 RepID=UPI0019096A7A|nr:MULTISPECIES: MetQ/NlpA family ABC transporter substrate-binding protein [unclassified Acinetobacter]MBK0062966.1 NLPA lipoprotein [Acinetobacter sp. S55]MBK0066616.1 NLPA lipoprotein [Acinetobacter sp. S54]